MAYDLTSPSLGDDPFWQKAGMRLHGMSLTENIQAAWLCTSEDEAMEFARRLAAHLKINEFDLATALTNLSNITED